MQHRTVAELMSRSVVRARRDLPFKEIVELLRDNDVTAVPVVDELDRPVGVVSEADLLRKSSAQPDPSGRTPIPHLEAWERAKDVLAACGDTLSDRGVTLCIEALAPAETNFIQTLDESARMADEIGHPNIDVMLDVKAISSMPDGVIGTIGRFGNRAKHFHANHPSTKGVGMPLEPADGEPLDWAAVMRALEGSGFSGWVSCEPFDYKPHPTTVAETAFRTLTAALSA